MRPTRHKKPLYYECAAKKCRQERQNALNKDRQTQPARYRECLCTPLDAGLAWATRGSRPWQGIFRFHRQKQSGRNLQQPSPIHPHAGRTIPLPGYSAHERLYVQHAYRQARSAVFQKTPARLHTQCREYLKDCPSYSPRRSISAWTPPIRTPGTAIITTIPARHRQYRRPQRS